MYEVCQVFFIQDSFVSMYQYCCWHVSSNSAIKNSPNKIQKVREMTGSKFKLPYP